ncbi:MAG TPA: DsbA family oxidoreductase, partial [Polyangiaceae bacterium]|nr:DsbA family oxidoreductase [Polyangiaceae bacterium]
EDKARAIGITGVPFFIFGGRYAVSGAQPAELFGRVLQQTWDEMAEEPDTAFAEGAACGPDGCA